MSQEEERLRPVCQGCGHADTATFSRTQLDVYDFRCPDCDSIHFKFVPVARVKKLLVITGPRPRLGSEGTEGRT